MYRIALLALLCVPVVAAGEDWPQFRGPNRDGISAATGLLRTWPEAGPKVLWSTPVCQGYAGPAIFAGKVYLNDYDEKAAEWQVRCLSLADGQQLWMYRQKKELNANHGITRTVPAVDGKYVFSFDPKCEFHCLNAADGKQVWAKNLVELYKTTIPPWRNGQCPLIESDRVIIATGGEALAVAYKKDTGDEIWRAPNPDKWPMSHASLMPTEIDGVRQYIYCTLKSLVGISAADGKILWTFPWKFNIAVAPSPLPLGDGRIFMTSCYNADTVMIRVKRDGDNWSAEKLFMLPTSEWNAEVHTPILYKGHMFAVGKKSRGLFTCLDLDGKIVWTSEGKASFGLGGFFLVDGMFFILDGDTGMLRVLDANATEYKELAHAQVLSGHDVWAPMALSDGKLVLRDMAKLVCIEVGKAGEAAAK